MRTTIAFVGGWLLWTTVGCGAQHAEEATAAYTPTGVAYSHAGVAQPAPAPAAESEGRSSASSETESASQEPDPRERPGLGTEWGETRASYVQDTTFLRVAPEHPFAVAELFYNDRHGVDALEAYHGGAVRGPLEVSIAGGTITMYLVDKEQDEPLEAERVGSRTYVVGEEGHRYGIVLANRSERRVEAVATVDGLDVMTGRTGSYENRGYILAPWATFEIDGFRKNHDEVAAFRFSSVGESYAGRRGEARNVGVIGVAFFAERGDRWSREELRMRDRASPFPDEGRFAQPPP